MEITADSKILEIFDAYPELEDKLIERFPQFSNLKNPVMRNTVARFATLKIISEKAGESVENMIKIINELKQS